MIKLHRSGHFPLEKLCTFYPISDFEKAISDVREGKVCGPRYIHMTKRLSTVADYKTRSPVGLVFDRQFRERKTSTSSAITMGANCVLDLYSSLMIPLDNFRRGMMVSRLWQG